MSWEYIKCDVHRHMGGSISPKTVHEILKRSGSSVSFENVKSRMVVDKAGIGFKEFLKKFEILDELDWTDWAIELAVKQICEDLHNESIDYCEVSLSLNKYIKDGSRSLGYVADYLADCFSRYSMMYSTKVGLLLSLRYDSPRDAQTRFSNIIDDPELHSHFCGIDLVGDENFYDAKFYKPIFDKWRNQGKTLRAHVGEMPGTAINAKTAITELNVTRIAHGIQASEDTMKLATARGVFFDLALHSNLTTGAVCDIMEHPLKRMVELDCLVTLNTDDPIQFNCNIDDEYKLALDNGLISEQQARQIKRNACQVSCGL